jgi:hypothetical protein
MIKGRNVKKGPEVRWSRDRRKAYILYAMLCCANSSCIIALLGC